MTPVGGQVHFEGCRGRGVRGTGLKREGSSWVQMGEGKEERRKKPEEKGSAKLSMVPMGVCANWA